VLKGVNLLFFTFGETNSEKDLMHYGNDNLNELVIKDLYSNFHSDITLSNVIVKVSYFEINNQEEVIDLLYDQKETNTNNVNTSNNNSICNVNNVNNLNNGLTELICQTKFCGLNAVKKGIFNKSNNNNKSNMSNKQSGMSSTIFRINIELSSNHQSNIYIIDLAGSENINTSKNINNSIALNRSISTFYSSFLKLSTNSLNSVASTNNKNLLNNSNKSINLFQDSKLNIAISDKILISKIVFLCLAKFGKNNYQETLSVMQFCSKIRNIKTYTKEVNNIPIASILENKSFSRSIIKSNNNSNIKIGNGERLEYDERVNDVLYNNILDNIKSGNKNEIEDKEEKNINEEKEDIEVEIINNKKNIDIAETSVVSVVGEVESRSNDNRSNSYHEKLDKLM